MNPKPLSEAYLLFVIIQQQTAVAPINVTFKEPAHIIITC